MRSAISCGERPATHRSTTIRCSRAESSSIISAITSACTSATDSVAVYPALAATVVAFAFAALSGKRRFKKVWVLHP